MNDTTVDPTSNNTVVNFTNTTVTSTDITINTTESFMNVTPMTVSTSPVEFESENDQVWWTHIIVRYVYYY